MDPIYGGLQLTCSLKLLWVVDAPVAVEIIVTSLVPQGQVVVGGLYLELERVEVATFYFKCSVYLCYSDVCSSRRDHDEIVVAHRHILVLDHVGRRLTSGTVPSTNSTFVLLFRNVSKCVKMFQNVSKSFKMPVSLVSWQTSPPNTKYIQIYIHVTSTKGK